MAKLATKNATSGTKKEPAIAFDYMRSEISKDMSAIGAAFGIKWVDKVPRGIKAAKKASK